MSDSLQRNRARAKGPAEREASTFWLVLRALALVVGAVALLAWLIT